MISPWFIILLLMMPNVFLIISLTSLLLITLICTVPLHRILLTIPLFPSEQLMPFYHHFYVLSSISFQFIKYFISPCFVIQIKGTHLHAPFIPYRKPPHTYCANSIMLHFPPDPWNIKLSI